MATTYPQSTRHQIRKAAIWIAGVLGGLIIAVLILMLALEFGDWRKPTSRAATSLSGRAIDIRGPVNFHTLTLTPRMIARDIRISEPGENAEPLGSIEELIIAVKLLPLFRGALILDTVTIDKPNFSLARDEAGRANWESNGKPKDEQPLKLPVIRDLSINDGILAYTDRQRNLSFRGTVSSRNRSDKSGQGAFALTGEGRFANAPFQLDVTGQSLTDARKSEPYDFTFHIEAVKTTVDAKGTIEQPFDLGALQAQLDVKGDDLASLYNLTGLALPNTPPYRASAHVTRDGNVFTLNDFKGRIGRSDIAGTVNVSMGEHKHLTADLESERLIFDDLGAILGARVSTNTSAADPVPPPKPSGKPAKAKGVQVIPNADLDLDRVRGMDADVRYRAKEIDAPDLPLKQVSLVVALKDGVLKLDPLAFTLPQGTISGKVTIDARQNTPRNDIDLVLSNAKLEQLLPSGDSPVLEGTVKGRLKVTGNGRSPKAAASNADGALALVVPNGSVRKQIAQLLGVDVARSLAILLSGKDKQTAMHCGLAHFGIANGRMTADNVVLDTDVTKITGSGTLDLASEALDFQLKGKPKKISLRLRAPVAIGGTLADPSFGIAAGPLLAQAGVAGALSALTPVASVVAFVDPGLTDDENCKELLQEAKASGAPVTRRETKEAPAAN